MPELTLRHFYFHCIPKKNAAPLQERRFFTSWTDCLDVQADIALAGELEETGGARVFDTVDEL
jgi:hypothetical protein